MYRVPSQDHSRTPARRRFGVDCLASWFVASVELEKYVAFSLSQPLSVSQPVCVHWYWLAHLTLSCKHICVQLILHNAQLIPQFLDPKVTARKNKPPPLSRGATSCLLPGARLHKKVVPSFSTFHQSDGETGGRDNDCDTRSDRRPHAKRCDDDDDGETEDILLQTTWFLFEQTNFISFSNRKTTICREQTFATRHIHFRIPQKFCTKRFLYRYVLVATITVKHQSLRSRTTSSSIFRSHE